MRTDGWTAYNEREGGETLSEYVKIRLTALEIARIMVFPGETLESATRRLLESKGLDLAKPFSYEPAPDGIGDFLFWNLSSDERETVDATEGKRRVREKTLALLSSASMRN